MQKAHVIVEDKAHAKFSASGAHRWLECPGSLALEAKAPPARESAAAKEGTEAHAVMEFVLNANIQNVVAFFERSNEEHPREMLEHVQSFVDFVRSLVKGPHYELIVEERVDLDGVITEPCDCDPEFCLCEKVAYGTVDVSVIEPFGVLHVIDFKYGAGIAVDAKDNEQMAYYALGIAHKRGYDFEKIKTTIYQPRIERKSGPTSTEEYSVDELLKWREKFRAGVKACREPNPPLKRGSHCFFCKAKITCPEIAKRSLEEAKIAFEDPVLPDPKDLAPTLISELLEKSQYLKLWIKDIEAYAEARLREGAKIPGFRLREKKAQKKWVNAEAVSKSRIGISLMQYELCSPAQAEKLLKNSLDFSKETIESFMKQNVVLVSSGLTIAKDETGEDFLEDEDFTPLIE